MNYPTANIIPVNTDTNVVQIEENRLVEVDEDFLGSIIQVRSNANSNLCNKAFYLSDAFDWIIVTDSRGQLVLVPMKKD